VPEDPYLEKRLKYDFEPGVAYHNTHGHDEFVNTTGDHPELIQKVCDAVGCSK